MKIKVWPFELESCYRKDYPLCYGFNFIINDKWNFHLGIGRGRKYDEWKVWLNFYKMKSLFELRSMHWKNH